MESKVLSVRLNGIPLGNLHESPDGLGFEYLQTATKAISLSLPIEKRQFENLPSESYFGGLLPESEDARKAIGKQFKVNPKSTFGLLSAIGHDCAGAISFHEPNEPVQEDGAHKLEAKPLSSKQLEKHIIELPAKPLFLGLAGLRLSLAGVQEKAAVCKIGSDICLPLHDTPTTHILKPAIQRHAATVQNEYICMKAAKQLGLPVANVEIRKAESQIYLLVERYDRKVQAPNKIQRMHQEDFCQALGNREKYEQFGGPSLADCFDLVFDFAVPVIDRTLLMQVTVFHYLIGNTDAHGKNFAVLYDERWKPRLAPFYDLVCTQVYDNLTSDMSMKIGGNFLHGEISKTDWEALCAEIRFAIPAFKKVVTEQTKLLPKVMAEQRTLLSESDFDSPVLDDIVKQVRKNCTRLTKVLEL